MERIAWRGDEHVLDVGCGDGRLTALLAQRVPHGEVLGIDSSPDMVVHAQTEHPKSRYPNLHFVQMDARHIRLPPVYSVAMSNAALHWVDDHQAFLDGVADALRSGGRLVVSCGGKGNAADVFKALRTEMRAASWRVFFRALRKPYFFHSDEDYHEWLPKAGFRPLTVRLVPKDTVHESVDAFTGWIRTTWMPYTHRVPGKHRDAFISAVVQRYLAAHPCDSNGAVHVRMVRLELEAVRV